MAGPYAEHSESLLTEDGSSLYGDDVMEEDEDVSSDDHTHALVSDPVESVVWDEDREMVVQAGGNDVDEYETLRTDFQKRQYDLQRFGGLAKVKTTRKQDKRRAKKLQERAKTFEGTNEQENPKTTVPSVPSHPRLPRSNQTEIAFDHKGRLWYSYMKAIVGQDGNPYRLYICERAVFHHWIRATLSRSENSIGAYAYPGDRKSGLGNWDRTCFNNMQRYWGLQRDHYAPVMFDYENPRRPGHKQRGNLYHRRLLVIDYWLSPVRDFPEIPLVISSQFEGGFIEPAMRIREDMTYRDVRARMPPFIEIQTKVRGNTLRPVYDHNTISNRARRFREQAGAISWRPEPSSDYVKRFIDTCPSQSARLNNSTKGCTDLTAVELRALRTMGAFTAPEKAKKGSTPVAQAKYKREIETIASKSSIAEITRAVPGTKSVIHGEQISSQERAEFSTGSLGPGHLDVTKSTIESEDLDMTESHLEPENLNLLESLRAMSSSPLARDAHYRIPPRPVFLSLELPPVTDTDKADLRKVLKPTIAHLQWFTGISYEDMEFDCSYDVECDILQCLLNDWGQDQLPRVGGSSLRLIRLVKLDAERAVWSRPWEAIFGEHPDFEGMIRMQVHMKM